MFCLVQFTDGTGCDCIPKTWLVASEGAMDTGVRCRYPIPGYYTRVAQWAASNKEPDGDWETFSCTVLIENGKLVFLGLYFFHI